MKIKDLTRSLDEIKDVLEEKSKELGCDDIEIVFRDDNGKYTHITCVEGGYAPDLKTNLLILSDGTNEIKEILNRMLGVPTVNADNIDIGEKLSLEGVVDDENH